MYALCNMHYKSISHQTYYGYGQKPCNMRYMHYYHMRYEVFNCTYTQAMSNSKSSHLLPNIPLSLGKKVPELNILGLVCGHSAGSAARCKAISDVFAIGSGRVAELPFRIYIPTLPHLLRPPSIAFLISIFLSLHFTLVALYPLIRSPSRCDEPMPTALQTA